MPDYMYMLESRLSAEQRAAMIRLQEVSTETGSNAYLTGGAVRDLISGMPIHDLDFTIEGNPSRVVRELEKSGARIVGEDEKTRHFELVFPGDVDGSISAAREDVYARPGTRPEIHWSTIMEDLRGRDFSLNAIAISLNPNSRGLLLDPANGLADLAGREVRGLSIHTFTNQPVRLLRAIRYAARMDFNLESRTAEWFALALERQLLDSISPADVGLELRQLTREDKPAAILKAWEAKGLIGAIHEQLVKRHPDYDMLNRILKARDDLAAAGLPVRLFAPVTSAVLGKLNPRERSAALAHLEYRASETQSVLQLEDESQKAVKMLAGPKTADANEAFAYLEKLPGDVMVFLMAEASNPKVLGKVRNYLHKWRPLKQELPLAARELETLGLAPGPKFDKVIEELFHLQLLGRARVPEDRVKVLRKLSGIKEAPKKSEEKEKKKPDDKLKKKLMGKQTAGAAEPPATGKAPSAAKKEDTKKKAGPKAAASAPSPAQRVKDQREKKTATGKGSAAHAATKSPAKKPSGRAK